MYKISVRCMEFKSRPKNTTPIYQVHFPVPYYLKQPSKLRKVQASSQSFPPTRLTYADELTSFDAHPMQAYVFFLRPALEYFGGTSIKNATDTSSSLVVVT
jgi:hypothetical protein